MNDGRTSLTHAKRLLRHELKEIEGVFGFGLTPYSVLVYVLNEEVKNTINWNQNFINLNKIIPVSFVLMKQKEVV